MGLYSVCSILKEAKYDLTTNVSVVDGMTNGAECIIKKIDYRVPGSLRPSIIWVLFQEYILEVVIVKNISIRAVY